jgi:hypothetical protein
MVLATWWYEDGPPQLERFGGLTVESPDGDGLIASMAGLALEAVAQRRAEGHRPYVARIDGEPAAYGWVASRRASIGELGLNFEMPAGNRYLWDFATLPAFRGRGTYPGLLVEIVRRECPPATRLWIIHAPENLPSGAGIARAGFQPVAELSFNSDGHPALASLVDGDRAPAAAELLGIPLVQGSLEPCWACGGGCDHSNGSVCGCSIVPSR